MAPEKTAIFFSANIIIMVCFGVITMSFHVRADRWDVMKLHDNYVRFFVFGIKLSSLMFDVFDIVIDGLFEIENSI